MEQKNTNELGIAGMVLGIISVTLSCILFGGLTGIIGLCLSIAGIRQKDKSTGSSLAGIILNSTGIIISFLAFILILFSFSGTESKPVISPVEKTTQTQTEIPVTVHPPIEYSQPDPAPSPDIPEFATRKEACTIGNSIKNSVWKIDFLDAGIYDKIGNSAYPDTPEEGKKFLALFFEVENISSSENYFNVYYFDCYVDGYVIDPEMTLNELDGYGSLFANIKPNKKHKGYLIFEVSPEWEKLEISYDESFGGTELFFELNKSDI